MTAHLITQEQLHY